MCQHELSNGSMLLVNETPRNENSDISDSSTFADLEIESENGMDVR